MQEQKHIAKLDVIIERCRAEFEKTPEYIADCANQKIIEKYQNAKSSFIFHPDTNGGSMTKEMQLLNKLKEQVDV